ncbi:hypothetical protein VTN00DRAFT_9602 [Thermoascus crustaceus]|uniref:uncharacterized protein n=1 Tax=Thermoascus crustaceus TaxID=5088 RepID=UPI0037424942
MSGPALKSPQNFTPLPLEPPLNWLPGPRLLPSNVIAGYHADYDKYDASTWAEYVLNRGKTFAGCTSTSSFSAINSGTPRIRCWFGYVSRGGPTTPDDYQRDESESGGVEDSVAFTIS